MRRPEDALITAARRKPPKDSLDPTFTPYKYGPHQDDPKDNPVFPGGPAYFVPGLGGLARAENRRRFRNRHAFNPGRDPRRMV